jgi:hypothetical protein
MSIVLLGSTSGSCTLQEQAIAGSTTLTLPTITGPVGVLVSGTAVASTSGTSIDFTGIPAGVRRITVMFRGVSTNGSSPVIVQLGDSGGIETSGYDSSAGEINGSSGSVQVVSSTAGFIILPAMSAAYTISGTLVITLVNSATNSWVGAVNTKMTSLYTSNGGGDKALSDVLTQLRITTAGGVNTFDAGSINILYE